MDQQLLFLINRQWIGPVADHVMALASSWAIWGPITLVLLIFVIFRGGFRARAFVVTALIVVGVNDGIVARTLKKAVDRPRPHQAMSDVRIVEFRKAKPRILAIFKPVKIKMSRQELNDVDGRSFPSSHTMNMFSVAIVAAFFFRKQSVWFFLAAALVSYSRIYTGSHWPSDVITSIFIAGGTTLLLIAGLDWLWRRRGEAWLPRLHAQHPSLFTSTCDVPGR